MSGCSGLSVRPRMDEADIIQKNITNKFLLTGARFCSHFENSYFYYDNGGLKIYFDEFHMKKSVIDCCHHGSAGDLFPAFFVCQ